MARGDAPPVLKPMGMGLGGYNYYACSPFADTIHSSREWIEYAPFEWGSPILDSNNPQFDFNGFPRYLNPDRRLRLLLWPYGANYYQRPSAWPNRDGQGVGKIVLTWKGNADLRLNNGVYLAAESSGAATGSLLDGRRVYRTTTGGVMLTVEEIVSPVTDINVWLPDPADPQNRTLEGQFWHPTFLERLRDFDLNHIRTMDWGDTNQSPQMDWADRRWPSHRGMGGILNQRAPANGFAGERDTGMAWEYMIQLANTLQRDLWICVPHMANDDYVTRLARLMRYGSDGTEPYSLPQANPVYPPLNPSLRLYVEYSNEIWSNGNSFPQGNWAQDQATAAGITKPQFNARRFCQIWRMFQETFGGSQRIVRVAAVWTGSSNYTDPFLQEIHNYGPTLTPSVVPDIVAPTTYFGNGIQDWSHQTASNLRNTSNAWYYINQDFDSGGGNMRPVSLPASDPYWTSNLLKSHQSAAFREWKRRILSGAASQGGGFDSNGLGGGFDVALRTSVQNIFGRNVPLVSYEGGPSLYTDYIDGGDSRDDGTTMFMETLNRCPEFAEIYRTQINMARAKGLRTHSIFVDNSGWGKYGQWGHLEYPDQNPSQAVKWQAMRDSETDSNSLRHIDDLLGSRPGFVTPSVLPSGTWLQFYSADIEASGGDTPAGSHLQLEVIGSLLSQGLTITSLPDQPTRLRVRGIPTEGGPNYLYVRVVDGDGDPAWRIFRFQIAGGPGLLVESDLAGVNPALNLPWAKTLSLRTGATFSGWQAGQAYSSSGGTLGGRGIQLQAGDNVLSFRVYQGSQNESDSTLASALADDEYWLLTIAPPSGQSLQLRNAEVRFTIYRDEYHAPRNWAVFTSVGGFSAGQQVFTSPRTTTMAESVEFVFTLPDTIAYENVGNPLVFRFYPYGSQYGHRSSIIGFKVSETLPANTPRSFNLLQQSLPWNGAPNDALDDADKDGVNNLLEYALGGNPLAVDRALPRVQIYPDQPAKFIYNNTGDPHLTYIVEASSELNALDWTELVRRTAYDNQAGTFEVTDPANPVPAKRFFRLRVLYEP